jgi:hypothetical protein
MEDPFAVVATDNRRKQDRRQRRISIVLNERRSGFDRRLEEDASRVTLAFTRFLLGLRGKPGVVFGILVVVNGLNLADFFLTLNVLAQGGGEANPILRSLFAVNPLYAGIFKVVAVLCTSVIAWRCRRYRSGLEACLILLSVFAGVIAYHIYGLICYV